MLDDDILKLQKILEKEITKNEYWENIQKRTGRGLRIIVPPLNCLVHQMCSTLLIKQHILWIGGPPGVGKTTCTKRFQDYGFMALDGEDPWNSDLSGLKKMTEKVHNELNTSFVFGACYGKYLKEAPKYVFPVLDRKSVV